MRSQVPTQTDFAPTVSGTAIADARPDIAEAAQRCQETGGIEGVSLEWMLDRFRPSEEART